MCACAEKDLKRIKTLLKEQHPKCFCELPGCYLAISNNERLAFVFAHQNGSVVSTKTKCIA